MKITNAHLLTMCSCVCGHNFCYKCGGDDETCDCDSEEEDWDYMD